MDFVEGWSEQIKEDLVGFADRETTPTVTADGRTLEVRWVVRGTERSELFVLGEDNNLTCASGTADGLTFGQFLTSEVMADFQQLAASTASLTNSQAHFVASDAHIEGPGFQQQSDINATPESVFEFVEQQKITAEGRTELYFLKGAPGAGKTTLLREITHRQAKRFLAGQSDFLFFYVTAQGRELSNLMDAFAGELQDLRANFTRDAIPALTRYGRLIPIVDGFDELLGTTGYGGAFSSLQDLLSSLNGLGSVVVSARSSFYDHEFLGRSTSTQGSTDIRITTIDLEPWTDSQLGEYLRKASTEDLSTSLANLAEIDRTLLRRPFFASEFPSFVSQSDKSPSRNSFYEHLMEAYISREAAKIVDSNGDPLLPVEGHEELFSQVASEMWDREARTLPLEDLQVVAEMVAEQYGLSGDATLQLEAKISSYAGLASGKSKEFGFEHEVYFDHFLARSFSRLLDRVGAGQEDPGLLFSTMGRGVIPQSVVSPIAEQTHWNDELLGRLSQCPTSARFENRRRNQGALVGAALADLGMLSDVNIAGLSFVDCRIGPGIFREVSFSKVSMVGADLRATRFEGCAFEDSFFHSVVIDNDSWLDAQGLVPGKNIGAVRHISLDGEIYAPQKIQEMLSKLGTDFEPSSSNDRVYSAKAEKHVMLLNYAARAYRRTTILFDSDENLSKLFSDEDWPSLRSIMLDTGVVSEESRAVAGPKSKSYRLKVSVEDLLRGQVDGGSDAEPVEAMWRQIEKIK